MLQDLMIDLETMSTDPHAAIIQLGAVLFNIDNDDYPIKTFERTISLQSNQDANRHIDANTVMWWLNKDDETRKAICTQPVPLAHAINDFIQFTAQGHVQRAWANDPDFDLVILRNAAKACRYDLPWPYHAHRSCRTMKWLAFPNHKRQLSAANHTALADAKAQAAMVQLAYEKLTT